MPISPAREAAYRILRRVESGRDFAVDLLQSPDVSALLEVDCRLATEIVMGTLRWHAELDFWVVKLSGKKLDYFDPEIATILRLSLYQILFLDKIPISAVVNEAVELSKAARKRSAAGLVNAVLRKCARPSRRSTRKGREVRPEFSAGETATDAVRSLPAWLADRWTRHFGIEAMESLAWASVRVPPTTLRMVRRRIDGVEDLRSDIQKQLLEAGITARPGEYSRLSLVVESGSVQKSPILRERRAVIQDEASQLVASLVAPQTGHRVLDLCSAPGIKTGQLADAMRSGFILSCDLSGGRLLTMKKLWPESLSADVRLSLVRLDATQELPFGVTFDRILVDAPCSGTGTLARNPEIKLRLQPPDLLRLARLQLKVLEKALMALAPKGRLVYSTCSLEPEENEQVVEKVLNSAAGFRILSPGELTVDFPQMSSFFNHQGFFRTRPDLHGMDGFFAAVIQRDG